MYGEDLGYFKSEGQLRLLTQTAEPMGFDPSNIYVNCKWFEPRSHIIK